MIYSLIKPVVRLALIIFCRSIRRENRARFLEKGPLLLVANHPNSFLDAIVIAVFFKHPLHFLARGDAFYKPWHNRILRLLNMIPVYRLSEGKENLVLNEYAFRRSREILAADGIVLIFIEGLCVNKHELQPFKKGAARIAIESRNQQGFRILPLGIAYDSFECFGKTMYLDAGNPLLPETLLPYTEEAKNFRAFNDRLFEEIQKRIHIPVMHFGKTADQPPSLWLPAMVGKLIHAPLYYPLKKMIRKTTRGTVFYDSVLFGSLLLLYPLYLLLIAVLLSLFLPLPLVFLSFIFLPLLAWLAVRYNRNNHPVTR